MQHEFQTRTRNVRAINVLIIAMDIYMCVQLIQRKSSCDFVFFSSENEKLSQREVVWQQVENLAKTKTDWMKNAGNYSEMPSFNR